MTTSNSGRWAHGPLPPRFAVMVADRDDMLSVSQSRRIVINASRGGVTWIPSDCSYAAVVDPRHPVGVAALDTLLDHGDTPIPITVDDEPLAARLIVFDDAVRGITGEFWPGGVGILGRPRTLAARRLANALHCPKGFVIRMSLSAIERQISATGGLPYTSAALRDRGQLVIDAQEALELAMRLHNERTPTVPTLFVRQAGRRKVAPGHSTMVSVDSRSRQVREVRPGSIETPDIQRAALSNHGVDWSEST